MLSTSKEYYYLFNKLTDLIMQLDSLKAELIDAQIQAEEIFLSQTEESSEVQHVG